MQKVLMPIGDAAEAMDTLYPYYRFQEEGYEAVVAGPEKRVYPLVMHEIPPGWDITRESPSYHLAATIAFRHVNPEEYIGLFLSGGRGDYGTRIETSAAGSTGGADSGDFGHAPG